MSTTDSGTRSQPTNGVRIPTRTRPVLGLLGLVGAACAVTGAAAVAGFFGRLWWVFDLCSHFRTQYAVVLGDFNASQWSAVMRDFRRGTGLRHSAAGHGLHLTWPTSEPLLYVPLDHILVSEQLWVLDSRVGPVVGSDHRPVIAELAP